VAGKNTRRVAWFFGWGSGDPEYDAETRSVFADFGRALVRGLVAGMLFAVVTAAIEGFDVSWADLVGRGTLFGLFMTVFALFEQRKRRDKATRNPSGHDSGPSAS
jgi:hypothetical protein